jgi:diaminopimelate epimerase|tara:strand:- start:2194 stop:3027 length:834 start_codon:yes stop_codon:yes gene_type:complete
MKFVKSHGLGNDYIVIDGKQLKKKLSKKTIVKICDRNFGIGSDGILILDKSKKADFKLIIYNPDGTQAEKSGNGLRIFSSFLFNHGYTKKKVFTIETKGGIVTSEFIKKTKNISYFKVDMGKAEFKSKNIPVKIKEILAVSKKIKIKNKTFVFTSVSIGNPHCVIFLEQISSKIAKEYGPYIETNKIFPKRINVQFAKIINRNKVEAEIWERGAGYTLASGSSSCAIVSAGYKLGLLDNEVKVKMPGGTLKISIDKNYNLNMEGPVEEICTGNLSFK